MTQTTTNGADLLATLQKKTGFEERDGRYGFDFDLAGDTLGEPIGPTASDFWSADQRANGVKVECVELSLSEEQIADGRAGERYRRLGGNQETMPQVVGEERILMSIHKVDGKVVPLDAPSRVELWKALGEMGRAVVGAQYVEYSATKGSAEEKKAKVARAIDRARASFRVRA